MEVHDTHSHEPVFCFSTIPAKKARCLEAARKHLLSSGGRPCRALLPCGQPPACLCWRRVSLRFQRGRTTSSGTDFLTQLSGRMLDLTKVYWTYTTFRRSTEWIPEVCTVGLAKAYPETDGAGGACILTQSTALSARVAAGTRGTIVQIGSFGYQDVCRLPRSASASTFASDGTVLTTYTSGQLAVVSFTCIRSNQCMQSFTRSSPSVPAVRSWTRCPPCA